MMQILVRSQDKTEVCSISKIEMWNISNRNDIGFSANSDPELEPEEEEKEEPERYSICGLGEYSSKEKVIKVVDKMLKYISKPSFLRKKYFQMPLEEEVK